MSINGNDIEVHLKSWAYIKPAKRDNNDYLISFYMDSGAEIAFDPRTKTKASIFVDALPLRLLSSPGVGKVVKYPPEKPSSALGRVSTQLNSSPQLFRIEVQTIEALDRLLEWIRWA